jgi:hypothetical protein
LGARTYAARIVAAVVVIVVSAACGQSPATPPPPDATPQETPEHAIAVAMQWRADNGLRADRAYVEAVARDPTAAKSPFGIPMLPAELAAFGARGRDTELVISIIDGYRGSDDEYGGVYVDQARGVVVASFTRNVPQHEAVIRAKLSPTAKVEFRLVKFSYRELRELQDRVARDTDWLAAVPAKLESLGVHPEDDALVFEVSSANPNAPALIAAHYRLGDALRVTSDGTGAALIPRGMVRGRVVAADGRPVHDLDAMLGDRSDIPGGCGGGDIGYGVSPDGEFEYPCQAGKRTILVIEAGGNVDPPPVLGEGTVVVVAGKTVELEIRLKR